MLHPATIKTVRSTRLVERIQRGDFGKASGGIMTMSRFPCQSPRSIVCQWSGWRQHWPSFMLSSTWSWRQSSSLLSTRGSHRKKAALLFLISFLTILTGSNGHLRSQRSTAWCCWPFGWSSCSSSNTGKNLLIIILYKLFSFSFRGRSGVIANRSCYSETKTNNELILIISVCLAKVWYSLFFYVPFVSIVVKNNKYRITPGYIVSQNSSSVLLLQVIQSRLYWTILSFLNKRFVQHE